MIYRTRKDNKKYVSAYKYKHNSVLHRYTLCRIIWLNNYLDNFTDFSEVDDVVQSVEFLTIIMNGSSFGAFIRHLWTEDA